MAKEYYWENAKSSWSKCKTCQVHINAGERRLVKSAIRFGHEEKEFLCKQCGQVEIARKQRELSGLSKSTGPAADRGK